jgi:ankyrin repeat protein
MADDLASSPLMAAAHRGHALIIDALAAAGARVDYARPKDGSTALYLASQVGQLHAVSSLIRANADPNQVMTNELASSPLMIAASRGHALVIDALAASGALVDYARPKDGVTALHLASQEGQLQAVRSLLLAGADPRLAAHDGTTALDDAKRNKHTAIVALLEARLAELAASP